MQIDKKMTDYLRGKKRAVMLDPEFPKEDFQVAKKKTNQGKFEIMFNFISHQGCAD